ncbi:hypothetical protein Q5752_001103 [Cryptotrichosporon argae]
MEEPSSPERVEPSSLPGHAQEVSMVEASDVTGVTFTPELWMQRRAWALQVLRQEGVRSVLDIGCGEGALLEILVQPPATIAEPPILPTPSTAPPPPSFETPLATPDLFISRLAGLDASPSVIPRASQVLAPPTHGPRWEPLHAELWLGAIERYNSRFEGYECITSLEVIEHLQPEVLSKFGVTTMGTYRPRLMLVTTPNFDFNAKFQRGEELRGFKDPTGRTARVFRHSDHKLEMTRDEFREWAQAAAADWGYSVELSGVGLSSSPSFYPDGEPVYASQTAVFRVVASEPLRSPRSVRTVALPFMRGSSIEQHPHRLAGEWNHQPTVGLCARQHVASPHLAERDFPPARPHATTRRSTLAGQGVEAPPAGAEEPDEVRRRVRQTCAEWHVGDVSVTVLWGDLRIAEACGGSKRWLVACLGGWGDVCGVAVLHTVRANGVIAAPEGEDDLQVVGRIDGLHVRWKGHVPKTAEPAAHPPVAASREAGEEAGGR